MMMVTIIHLSPASTPSVGTQSNVTLPKVYKDKYTLIDVTQTKIIGHDCHDNKHYSQLKEAGVLKYLFSMEKKSLF